MNNTTNNVSAANVKTTSAAVTNMAEAKANKALGKLGLFELRSMLGTIMTPTAILADAITVSDTVNDTVRGEISSKDAAYSAKTLGKIFAKEELDALRRIRDAAADYLDSVGTRIPGQSAWYTLANRHDEISLRMADFQGEFETKVNEIVANYDDIVTKVNNEINAKVSSANIADAIKEKIPSVEEVHKRCNFSVTTAKLFDPSALAEGSKALAVDIANGVTAIQAAERGFWGKLTTPFSDMLKKLSDKQRDMLGRKVTAMTHAVDKALSQEMNLSLIFSEGEDKVLLEQILTLLKEVKVKFCIRQQIPSVLEESVLDTYYRLSSVFASMESVKTFIDSGEALFPDGWDLRDLDATYRTVTGNVVAQTAAPAEAPAAAPAAEAETKIEVNTKVEAEAEAPVVADAQIDQVTQTTNPTTPAEEVVDVEALFGGITSTPQNAEPAETAIAAKAEETTEDASAEIATAISSEMSITEPDIDTITPSSVEDFFNLDDGLMTF